MPRTPSIRRARLQKRPIATQGRVELEPHRKSSTRQAHGKAYARKTNAARRYGVIRQCESADRPARDRKARLLLDQRRGTGRGGKQDCLRFLEHLVEAALDFRAVHGQQRLVSLGGDSAAASGQHHVSPCFSKLGLQALVDRLEGGRNSVMAQKFRDRFRCLVEENTPGGALDEAAEIPAKIDLHDLGTGLP